LQAVLELKTACSFIDHATCTMNSAKSDMPAPISPLGFILSEQNLSPRVERFDHVATVPPNITGVPQVIELAQSERKEVGRSTVLADHGFGPIL